MRTIGRVESLWRYPVKSMRGESLPVAFAGYAGFYGDRVYAFQSTAAPKGFPWLTGREQERMLQYQPVWKNPESMVMPTNYMDAEALFPGLTPVYAEPNLEVENPLGKRFAIHDPLLLDELAEGLGERHSLSLLQSGRALTDARPLSLFSLQTVAQLGKEVNATLDKRRFRANVYLDLASGIGFEEDQLVGHTIRIGSKLVVSVLERDPRCKMITLDPDTSEANPEIIKSLAKNHETKAGVFAAVLAEGLVQPGDEVAVLN